jgi:hypothetical protein
MWQDPDAFLAALRGFLDEKPAKAAGKPARRKPARGKPPTSGAAASSAPR